VVLPGEDGALPYRAVPSLDEGLAHPTVLVVLIPDSDSGAPLQGTRRQSGSYGSAGSGKGRGQRGRRSWVPRESWVPGGKLPLFLPAPSFTGCAFFCFFLLSLTLAWILFLCNFRGAHLIVLGQAWAEGKRGACSVLPLRGRQTEVPD